MKINDLFEGYLDGASEAHISEEQANIFLKEKCPLAFNSQLEIYKGIEEHSHGQILYSDSSKYLRSSANTSNYYTILIDNFLNPWKQYPKRSRSFICSTSEDYAEAYGQVYQVYPIGDPIIGFCPQRDIWESFQNINLMNAEYMFRDIMKICDLPKKDDLENIKWMLTIADEIWENEGNDYEKEKKEIIETILRNTMATGITINSINRYAYFRTFLTWLFDPTRNNFHCEKLSSCKLSMSAFEGQEIWFSGPAYFREID